jgi:3-hydroxyacyl-[acyl-carrier protein] dehydratase/trans-2-decenoyl-[acyl-carrier protein] isomerase
MSRKNSYDIDELILAGTGDLFGQEYGKLPLPNMLMMDRITHIDNKGGLYGKGEVVAELDIKPDLWFFDCHFKGDAVMPGSLGLDALLQLTGFFLVWADFKGKGRALGCEKLKFFGQVLPTNKKVTYVVDIKRIINLKLTMIIADGRVLVDDKEIYSCENMRVGLFAGDEIVL